MHYLVVGMPESGKTTLAKIYVANAKKTGLPTAVLDPLGDPAFGADFQTKDPNEFLEHARIKLREFMVIDESGTAIGRYNEPMQWLATTSRHYGKSCMFCMQSCAQLPPIIRDQCGAVYLFNCSSRNVDLIAEEFNQPSIRMGKLEKGEFLSIPRFGQVRKMRVDFADKLLYACQSVES